MRKSNLPENEPFLILSDDGFSQFCEIDPENYSFEDFVEHNVGYLRDYPGVKVKAFGVGPGSVFTYDTKVGEAFMAEVSDMAFKVCRTCDRKAHGMVKKLNESGKDGMTRVVEKCREMGIIPWARFEMNHEYGPCNEDNFTYACFVGKFNKEHPEYRVMNPDGSPRVYPMLDFKHKAVRDFKVAIIKEVAEHGVDGIILEFCVYPPFFTNPKEDGHYMTDLIRDARRVLDEVGEKEDRHIDLIVTVEQDCEERLNIEWRTWVREGLIDWIAPRCRNNNGMFEVPVEEFLKECEGTGCRVISYINTENAGRVNADPSPHDARSAKFGKLGPKERPNRVQWYYARAFGGIKAGAAAVQLATSSGAMFRYGEAHWHPLVGTLSDFDFLRRAEKEYNFNNIDRRGNDLLPVTLTPPHDCTTRQEIFIGDAPEDVEKATLVVMARGLTLLETVTLTVNGHEMILTEKDFPWSPLDEPILPTRGANGVITKYNTMHLCRIHEWWNICKNEIDIPTEWLKEGKNEFVFTYKIADGKPIRPFEMGEMSIIIQPKA